MNICPTINNLAGAMLLCSISATAYAAPLSPQQAMARVQSSQAIHKMPGSRNLVLAHTDNVEGDNYLYVFNNGSDGFIIASADDRMPAVLGYSDNGAFDITTASPELKWWLQQYSAQANSVLNSGNVRPDITPSSRAPRAKVPELMYTLWNQNDPYNRDCPVEAGKRCYAGCVATAMAQVIKYHGYPATGTGYHSYDWKGRTLSYDYSSAHFDYSKMADEYYSSTTDAQKQAVANLMYACGVSVDMKYGTDASSAYTSIIAYALTEYFNYDKDIRYLERKCYTTQEWEDIVYEDVSAGRPVIYRGQSDNGGHAFVCDGYDEGYFHINWGWSGSGNGWFLLSALDPGLVGIGGHEGGYSEHQAIICGIRPDTGNPQTTYPLITSGGLSFAQYNNYRVEVTFSGGYLSYYWPAETTISFFLKAVSASGEEYVGRGKSLTFPEAADGQIWGYNKIPFYLPDVGPGEYSVYLMYQGPQGNLLPVSIPVTEADHLIMNVDANGDISFSLAIPDNRPRVRVLQFKPESEVFSGKETDFYIVIENISEYAYLGNVYFRIYQPDSEEVLITDEIGEIDIDAGKTASGDMPYVFDLPDGMYVLRCYDMYDEACSEDFNLVIGNASLESLIKESGPVDIYSLSGLLIRKDAGARDLDALPRGIYIIRSATATCKIMK